jgi:hypothetical protein
VKENKGVKIQNNRRELCRNQQISGQHWKNLLEFVSPLFGLLVLSHLKNLYQMNKIANLRGKAQKVEAEKGLKIWRSETKKAKQSFVLKIIWNFFNGNYHFALLDTLCLAVLSKIKIDNQLVIVRTGVKFSEIAYYIRTCFAALRISNPLQKQLVK